LNLVFRTNIEHEFGPQAIEYSNFRLVKWARKQNKKLMLLIGNTNGKFLLKKVRNTKEFCYVSTLFDRYCLLHVFVCIFANFICISRCRFMVNRVKRAFLFCSKWIHCNIDANQHIFLELKEKICCEYISYIANLPPQGYKWKILCSM
jgi:hypothetical protein